MKQITILIFEDEALAGNMLADYCIELGYQVLGIYANGEDFVERITENGPDLLLLDINLDGTNALELYEQIKEKSIPVIFVTAYTDSDTIDRAMKLNPEGYLVKPITKGQLKAQLIQAESHLSKYKPLLLKKKGIANPIYPSEVIYLEADRNYTYFVHTNGEITKVRKTLSNIKNEISDDRFIQVHRSFIINAKHLISVEGTKCLLNNDFSVPVGRSYKQDLLSRIHSE